MPPSKTNTKKEAGRAKKAENEVSTNRFYSYCPLNMRTAPLSGAGR